MNARLLRVVAEIRSLWKRCGLDEPDLGRPIVRPPEDYGKPVGEVARGVLKRDALRAKRAFEYGVLLVRQSILACVVGVLTGVCGVAFQYATSQASLFFFRSESLGGVRPLYFLPFVGLAIVWLYRRAKLSVYAGTNEVVDALTSREKPSLLLAPLIFLCSVLTHLCGGSAGREGAALQLGGCVGLGVAKIFERFFRLQAHETHVAILCGMSGGFAAVFNAPLTATVFALEIACVGVVYYPAFLPALLTALLGASLASSCGFHSMARSISPAPLTFELASRTIIFGVLCGLACVFFCSTIRRVTKRATLLFANDYSRVFFGGVCVVLATLAVRFWGANSYNGMGLTNIVQAFNGEADPWDFVLKTIFTALSLGCGYKGGEIVPALAVGATFGAFAAPLLGVGAELGASLGMVALFCGTTNCTITALLLGVELFGFQNAPLFAIVCGVAYLTSGHAGLYRSQRVFFSKLTANPYDPRLYDVLKEDVEFLKRLRR